MKTSANLDAERGVLSALVQDVDPAPAFAQLTPKDFFDKFHRRLYAHFKSTIEQGHPLVYTAIADEMKLDQMEQARLAELSDKLMVIRKPGELARLVRIVKRDAHERDLKKICNAVIEGNGDATGLILNLQAKVQNYFESLRETIEDNDQLLAVELEKFLRLEIPEREKILDPILESQAISELHAPRGTGKTCFALAFGLAIASGGTFLKWRAPKPRRVLYLDGEMPAVMMQSRLNEFMAALDVKPQPGFFKIITPDLQPGRIPDLAFAEGRALLDPHVKAADFIVLDNLSAWVRSGIENEAESWLPMQDWLLGLRRDGKTSMFLQHSGKSGMQRGTSKREDLLDLVINLKRPSDYRMSENLRAEVHFEKSRTALGKFSDPFEICLEADQGHAVWTMKDLGDALDERAQALYADGLTVREVAAALGISRSTAGRLRPAALSHVPR